MQLTEQLFKAFWGDDAEHIKFICYGEKGKPPNKQFAFKTIEEGTEYVEMVFSSNLHNIYYTPALFSSDKRSKSSFAKCKVLWVDLDLKGMPKGSTLDDAALQLKRLDAPFVGNCWVVFTGHGFHAYWILDKFLEKKEWERCANYLTSCLKKKGICFDPITTDCSRMLRVPRTYNYKDAEPILAEIIKKTDCILNTDELLKTVGQFLPKTKIVAKSKDDPILTELASTDYPLSDANLIVKQCAFIKQFNIDGFHENEPAWNAAINAIRLCENGNEVIHELSAKSSQYTEQETSCKINAKDRADMRPTTCEYICQFGFCKECPYKGKITTPIQLGYKVTPLNEEAILQQIVGPKKKKRAQECIQYVPIYPWEVGKEGIFFIDDSKDKMERVPVCPVPFHIVDLLAEDYTDHTILTVMIQAFTPHRDTFFKLPLRFLADSKKYIGEFNARKIFPFNHKYLSAYIKKYISNLEKANIMPQMAVNSLGWQKNNSFVYSSKGAAFQQNGEPITYIFDAKATGYINSYSRKGTLEPWHEVFNIYNSDPAYIPHLFSLLCSIGTPLMYFTSAQGIALSLCACSGSGKTLAHKVAMSIWGNPETAGVLGVHDTHTALIGRMAAVKNLPLRLDEITKINPKILTGLIYELVNGKGRARAAIDGSLSGTASQWQTLTLITTNDSLLDKSFKILGEAERNRILEMHVKMPTNMLKDARRLDTIMRANYGIIGELFIKEIISNKESWLEFIDKFQVHTGQQVDSSKRFWVSCGAIAFAAVKFCLKLGLNIDKDGLLNWFCSFIKESEIENNKTIQENRGFQTAEEMAVALRDSLEGSIKILNVTDNMPIFIPSKPVLAYIIRDMPNKCDYLYVRASELKNFLQKHYQSAFKYIKQELDIKEPKTKRFGDNVIWAYEFKIER